MQLTRLKLAGFKTFVEPTEFLIEPGLTGVVGPNGCGKSNLVEALRWVMGENLVQRTCAARAWTTSSSPVRRAARPATWPRWRSPSITSDRTAPAAFNDMAEIAGGDAPDRARVRARPTGSTARRCAPRDVQLLFADAATGARSPALVRQGQISEIICRQAAIARRQVLEDAAGIAGLHARRHEAELRCARRRGQSRATGSKTCSPRSTEQVEALGNGRRKQAERYRNLACLISASRRGGAALIADHGARRGRRPMQSPSERLEAAIRDVVADSDAARAGASEPR